MKRLIAKRRLQRKCAYCNGSFKRGEVYYKEREVSVEFSIEDGEQVHAFEWLTCPKCKYQMGRSNARLKRFKKACAHPSWAIETIYRYIPGEAVKEPSHSICRLCHEIV